MTYDTALEKANTIVNESIKDTVYHGQMSTIEEKPEDITITVLMFGPEGNILRSTYGSEVNEYDDINWDDFESYMVENATHPNPSIFKKSVS